ncbi:MAG: DUF1254 domain-containing protein [Pseudomonadota bacterium]
MSRIFYTLTVGAVLAGIVHIVIVLLVPSYAAKDAWATLASSGEPWSFSVVAQPGSTETGLPLVDPSFGVAACRFDLSKAAVSVTADGQLPFWSVAIFDRQGRNIYSFNDRTAIERRLNMLVMNPVQMAQYRKANPDAGDRAVIVRADMAEGFVLIRALQPDDSWGPALQRFMGGAKCEPYDGLTTASVKPSAQGE